MLNRPLFLFLACVALFAASSWQRVMSMDDLQDFVDGLSDEILSHESLRSSTGNNVGEGIYDVADTDNEVPVIFQSAKKDEDVPHPVHVYNWGANTKLGKQVSGVAISPDDEPVVFHRGDNVWDRNTFDPETNKLVNPEPIEQDTIVTLDPDTAEIKSSWGGNGLFYMPHGITIDNQGNTYVTDVGLHQVMRFPNGSTTPDLVLGEKLIPGTDDQHFCKPTAVAVTEDGGTFFVADGYCNARVLKYNAKGELLKVINGIWKIPHDLTLFEDEDVLCVADREANRIDCFRAGLQQPKFADVDSTGEPVVTYAGVNRPFAIASKGTAILSIGLGVIQTVKGITIDTAADLPQVIDTWGKSVGITSPHGMAISQTGDAVYVVEVDAGKDNNIHKFEVMRSPTFF